MRDASHSGYDLCLCLSLSLSLSAMHREISRLEKEFVNLERKLNWIEFFLNFSGTLKKVFILFGLNVFVYASAYNTINAYAEIIITSSKVSVTPSIVVMGLGFSTIIAGATATFVVDKFGRKNLLIVSSIGVAMSLNLLSLNFHLLSLNFDPEQLTWLLIASLLSFNISVCYGLIPVPSTLLGEMFPANLKNLASLCIASGSAILTFMFSKTYQPFLDMAGQTIVFCSYGLFVFLAVPYVWYFIPETKGKSLLDIQRSVKS